MLKVMMLKWMSAEVFRYSMQLQRKLLSIARVLIVRPEIAEAQIIKEQSALQSSQNLSTQDDQIANSSDLPDNKVHEQIEKKAEPTRFTGSVMISSDRPAKDMHQIVEAIVEQLTTLPGSEVNLRLEIDAEVPVGLDCAKVRTLIENANTLGFIDKSVS